MGISGRKFLFMRLFRKKGLSKKQLLSMFASLSKEIVAIKGELEELKVSCGYGFVNTEDIKKDPYEKLRNSEGFLDYQNYKSMYTLKRLAVKSGDTDLDLDK